MVTNETIQRLLDDQKTHLQDWVGLQMSPVDSKLILFMQRKKELMEQFKSKLPAESLPKTLSEGPSEEEKLRQFEEAQRQLEIASTPQQLSRAKNTWAGLIGKAREELQQLVALSVGKLEHETNEELAALIAEANSEVAQSKLASGEREVLKYLEELFANESTFIANILKLRTILSPYREEVNLRKLTPAQRESVTTYLNDIDRLLEAYQTLGFHQPIAEASTTPEEVIIDADRVFKTEQFARYTDIIKALAHSQKTIDAIAEENATFQQTTAAGATQVGEMSLSSCTIRPPQHIARYRLQWTTIVKELNGLVEKAEAVERTAISDGRDSPRSSGSEVSISSESSRSSAGSAYEQAKKIGDSLNLEVGNKESIAIAEAQMKAAPRAGAERQAFALRKILELNLNTPLQNNSTHPEGKYLDPYLKTMLAQSYSDVFSLDRRGELVVNISVGHAKYGAIYEAFGLDTRAPAATFKLDPAKFNAETFDRLYKGADRLSGDANPLWLVLKSTMPISETFTAEQKIQTYQELAAAAVAGQLGGTDKYIVALNLQKAAFAIATEHDALPAFTAAFGPDSELGRYIDGKIREHRSELRSVSIADIQAVEISKVEAAVAAQKESIQEKLGEVTPKLTTEPEDTRSLHQELSVELRRTLTSAKESMNALKTAASILQTSLNRPDADRAELAREHARISNELATIYDHGRVQSQLRSVEQRAAAKREEVAQLETLLRELKERCTTEEVRLTTVGSTNATLKGALSEQKAAIIALQEKLIAVNAELDGLQITHQALSQEATALASEKKSLNSMLATLDTVLTLQAEKRELAGQLAETTSTLRSEREALSRANDELIHIRSSLDTASQESTRLRRQIEELTVSHTAKLKEIGLENTEARRQLVEEHSSQLQQLQTRLQHSEEHGSSLAEQLTTKSRTLEDRETELSRLRDTLVKQELAQQQLQERFEALTSTHHELGVQLHTQEEATAEARHQFEEANATLVLLQETHRELTSRSERLASENGALREQIAPLQARVQDLELQLAARDEELRAARETASMAMAELQSKSSALEEATIEISALRAQLDELRRQQELPPPLIRDTVSSARAAIRTMRDGSEEVHAAPAKISFAEFCAQFKARFPKTNSDGIKDMIKFMESIRNDGHYTSDEDKFAATAKRMHDIAADRADSAWLQNKKLGLFGSGRSPEVQKLYNAMKQDDFSLNSEITKNFLLGRESAAPSSERAFKS